MEKHENTVRAFVCIVPPEDVVSQLDAWLDGVMASMVRGTLRRVAKDAMHLTLRFLSEAPQERVSAIARELAAVAVPAPFDLTVTGSGGFPSLNRPRVIWAGVNGGSALFKLVASVEEAASRAGYEPETRKFTAHMTLARAGEPCVLSSRTETLLSRCPRPAFRCESFILMKSVLTRQGPIYEPLGEYFLRGGRKG